MRYPWVNVILLVLLSVQLATGYLGFTNGRSSNSWLLWLHGIGAYALIVLLYWKGSIIFDSIDRKKRWTRKRIGFLVLAALLLATLLAGLLWTFYGPIYLFGFSLVTIHIFLAIPLMALLLWHGWQMRFIFRVGQTWQRRLFLQTAISTIAGLVAWRAADSFKGLLLLPGASRRFTGSYERGSFGGQFPSVSWIADRPEPVDLKAWRLVIDGAVERPLSINYEELLRLANDELTATLDCTGGWFTTQVWQGVPLPTLLNMAGLGEGARSVTVAAVSGYSRRFNLAEAQRYLLAVAVAGNPLSHGHGLPVRLVAPDQRGVNWVKWVSHIRINRSSKLWQSPLPLR